MTSLWNVALPIVLIGCTAGEVTIDDPGIAQIEHDLGISIPGNVRFLDPSGYIGTFSTQGAIDLGNEFFADLGTNGRRCVTCHLPSTGWTISPPQVRAVFDATRGGELDDLLGLGAIFRTNDGANSPVADVSTLAKRRKAYSMLLTRGLIRIGMAVPPNAEFELFAVDDPYGYAKASELSLFRRPLPSTNLKFLSAVMWDGRETQPNQTIHFDLSQQANDATEGHAQGDPLTAAQRESIVDFETALFTAQSYDFKARDLADARGKGGHEQLSKQKFYIGINDLFGDSKTQAPFDPVVFTIFSRWADRMGTGVDVHRRAVARGEILFNTRPINISGVSGINDEPVFGNPANVVGTCTTCHDSPNAGNHSVVAPLNLGLTDASRRTPDMPLYTFRHKVTHQLKQTTDPGRALISGRWKDIGRFKGPVLRGLAARAPYFHNGFAADLGAVVEFYDDRFHMNLTAQEKSDLVAFLSAL